MPVLAHLHQLFHADTCHTSIHTLRWNDRPLRCPRCQSYDVRPWGMYHYRVVLKNPAAWILGHIQVGCILGGAMSLRLHT